VTVLDFEVRALLAVLVLVAVQVADVLGALEARLRRR
jgi:hypothetical protein